MRRCRLSFSAVSSIGVFWPDKKRNLNQWKVLLLIVTLLLSLFSVFFNQLVSSGQTLTEESINVSSPVAPEPPSLVPNGTNFSQIELANSQAQNQLSISESIQPLVNGHYPSHVGDIAYFGWIPEWNYNGNREGSMHFQFRVPKYVNYMGGFTIKMSSGFLTSSSASYEAQDNSTGWAGIVHVMIGVPASTYVRFELGFNLQIDYSVPDSYDSISNVCPGTDFWTWNNVDDQGVWHVQTGTVSGSGYEWPIIRPTIDVHPTFGVRGDPLTVYGHDFHAGASVVIKFNQTQVASVSADSTGFFVANFNVPSDASLGIQTIKPVSSADPDARNTTFAVKRGYAITLVAQPSELTADGKSNATITARITDRQGIPVQGDTVIIGLDNQVGKLEGSSSVQKITGSDGKVQTTYTSANMSEFLIWFGTNPYGTVHLSALEMTDGNQTSSEIVLQNDFALTIEANPTSIMANGKDNATVTATLKNLKGTPLEGYVIGFTTDPSIGKVDGSTYAEKRTTATGQATITFTAPNATEFLDQVGPQGTINIIAQAFLDPENTSSIQKQASISLNVKYQLTVEAAKNIVSADDKVFSVVTATLTDEKHLPVQGQTISFNLSPSVGTIDGEIQKNSTTDVEGKAHVTYYAPITSLFYALFGETATEGKVKIAASVVIDPASGAKVTRETSITIRPCTFTVIANPNKLLVDGKSNSNVTILLRDGEDKPISSRTLDISVQPYMAPGFSDYLITNPNGEVNFTYVSPTPDSYFNTGGPSYVEIHVTDPKSGAENSTEKILLGFLDVSAFWTRGALVEWRWGSIDVGLVVNVRDGRDNPVSGAKVTVYHYANDLVRKTDGRGIASFDWGHPSGNDMPSQFQILDFQIVVGATINGVYFEANKSIRMVIGLDGDWMDHISQKFWDDMSKELQDALAAYPGLPNIASWATTLNSVRNRLEVLKNPDATGAEKWKALRGSATDIIAESLKEGENKMGIKLALYFVEKIEVIIDNWSKYFDSLKPVKPGEIPPVSDYNGDNTTPNGKVTFKCPINVLILHPSGYIIGTATSLSNGSDFSTNELWQTSDYNYTADQKQFTFYNLAKGDYLIRIVGTADGNYSFTIEIGDQSGTLFNQTYSGTIHQGEVQWKILAVDLSSTIMPIQGINIMPMVQSCDIGGTRKDYFNPGENVYTFGDSLPANSSLKLYVKPHKTWTGGEPLTGMSTMIQTDANGTTNIIPIWTSPLTAGAYDIILDVNNNGIYDPQVDTLDTSDLVALSGFFVERTLTVPDDYPTIQAAIDASKSGDTIYVKSGIYSEDITFPSYEKYVTIIGQDRTTTILDGPFSLSPSNPEDISVRSLTIVGVLSAGALFDLSDSILKNSVELQGWGGCNIKDNVIEGGLYFHPDENVALHDILVKGNILHNFGILLQGWYGSYSNTIINNTVVNAQEGIVEEEELPNDPGTTANIITGNYITGCYMGIQSIIYSDPAPSQPSRTNITRNTLISNYHGLWIERVNGISVWQNNFINNTIQAVVASQNSSNAWDNGYSFGGNYWSNYNGTDSNHDGIGDTPYVINVNNTDRYPLMTLWTPTLTLMGVTAWYWTSTTRINAVAYVDTNSDGQTEIVTGGTFFDGTRNIAQLIVWNSSNLAAERIQCWYWTGNTTINSVAVGDVNGDGQIEIVTGGSYFDGTRYNAQLIVWNGSSLAVEKLTGWYWTGNTIINSVAAGDVDGDGHVEIVTGGSYFDSVNKNAQLIVWDGSNLSLKKVTCWKWTGDTVVNSVGIGDVNADGQTEIFTGGSYFDGTRNNAQLVVWNGANLTAAKITGWYWTSNTVINSVALGDVNGDGHVEIVSGGYYNDGTRNNAQLIVWNGTNLTVERITGWYWSNNTVINSVAIGEVTGDGQAEIVTAGQYNDGSRDTAQLALWSGSNLAAIQIKSWYWTSNTKINSVTIGDINNDFSNEIITGGSFYDGTRQNSQLTIWSMS